MTNSPVQRQIRYSFTSSHLQASEKTSGSFFCTHLYFQSGSLTLVEAARVRIRLLSSIGSATPETVRPWVWVSRKTSPAR